MKRHIAMLLACCCTMLSAQTTSYKFDFSGKKKAKEGYILVTPETLYTPERGYGYDFVGQQSTVNGQQTTVNGQQSTVNGQQTTVNGQQSTENCQLSIVNCQLGNPFYFSVDVPDGNYRVNVVVGNRRKAGVTTLRGESRRLFYERVATKRGEYKTCSFTINKRNTLIEGTEHVRIKDREKGKLNWDDKLTIEVNGPAPQIMEMTIERVDDVPTIFLCGNSTVVDQDNEPWASWGQMITRFFDENVCFANYAESGETAVTFIGAKRLKKLLTQVKPGDYIVVEFGHNDQKRKGVGDGAFYSFMYNMKIFVDEARRRGATPILVTPTQRRSFNAEGKITDTHLDYPEATRFLANREGVHLIDLHAMTRVLYEAMGPEASKGAFVHYPANTYPGQAKPLADNTHFNPYGAYQISKCIIEGMKKLDLDILKSLRADYVPYDPAHPDDRAAFQWDDSRFVEVLKPDGN